MRSETASAIEAVRRALSLLSSRVGSSQIYAKGALDFATGTDLASQEIIRSTLQARHPTIAFRGEEGDSVEIAANQPYWLVDPICGTNNFAANIPLYAVNVALVEDGIVTAAVVGDGATRQLYVAERGQGAWEIHGQQSAQLFASDASSAVLIESCGPTGPDVHRVAQAMQTAVLSRRWHVLSLASTIGLTYVASGRVAGVRHVGSSGPMHQAAGMLLALEAGCLVTDEYGDPWTPRSNGLVAGATPETHAALLNLAPG